MLLMIDNYDSFTFNLVQYFGELGQDVRTVPQRRDHVAGMAALARATWCSRPGPARRPRPACACRPSATLRGSCPSWACAWATRPSARRWAARSFAPSVQMHGKTSRIRHDGEGVYRRCRRTSP
jgi:anthranilate synthase component 2